MGAQNLSPPLWQTLENGGRMVGNCVGEDSGLEWGCGMGRQGMAMPWPVLFHQEAWRGDSASLIAVSHPQTHLVICADRIVQAQNQLLGSRGGGLQGSICLVPGSATTWP